MLQMAIDALMLVVETCLFVPAFRSCSRSRFRHWCIHSRQSPPSALTRNTDASNPWQHRTVICPDLCGSLRTAHRASRETQVNFGKHGRPEQQRRHRREQQAADDRTAEWRILLGAFAQAQRHRDHAIRRWLAPLAGS
jgi:hypothetical protein